MKKNNVFIKPSGKLKGSGTMAAKGDIKGAPASRLRNNVGQKLHSQKFGSMVPQNGKADMILPPASVVAMAKVFKKYPQIGGGIPNASKVVKANSAARNIGPALSQANSKRKLKYIGA